MLNDAAQPNRQQRRGNSQIDGNDDWHCLNRISPRWPHDEKWRIADSAPKSATRQMQEGTQVLGNEGDRCWATKATAHHDREEQWDGVEDEKEEFEDRAYLIIIFNNNNNNNKNKNSR